MLTDGYKSVFRNSPVLFRIIALNLGIMSSAMMLSWSSPCLPLLDGSKGPQNNPLSAPITTLEKSLLVSAPMLSATLTCFLPPILIMYIKRKPTYILLLIPNIIGLLILGFGFNFWMLYIGRLLCGVTFTAANQIVPRYAAELTLPENRGAMGSFMAVFITLGHLSSFSIGSFVSFSTFNYISLTPSILVFLLLVFYVDESPHDLILKNPVKAKKILTKLRRKSYEDELDIELENIRVFAESYRQFNLRDFCTSKALRRSLAICVALLVFAHLTGLSVVAGYMQHIFTDAKVNSPELATIYVGIVQFLSTFFTSFIMDRAGRKVILAVTQIGIFICLCTFAVYNMIVERTNYDVSSFHCVPIISLFCFSCLFYNGIGLVPFILMGEIFPPNYKIVSSTVAICFQTLCIFLMTWGYPVLVENIHLSNTFWIYAGFTLLGFIFIIVFVPETKQKTFHEIQAIMES